MSENREKRLIAYAVRKEKRAIASNSLESTAQSRHIMLMAALAAQMLAAGRRDIARAVLANMRTNLSRSRS